MESPPIKESRRTISFKRRMNELPDELLKNIIEFIPEDKEHEPIVRTNFYRPHHLKSAYIGLTDERYNTLPKYRKDLALKISGYGTFDQVKNTLDRWYSPGIDQDFVKFKENYPYSGQYIHWAAIQTILNNERKVYVLNGGTRLTKMRTKRRISKKRNTKKRISKK
jgi:hypothetical protein